jgi:hypothetical protein
MMIDGKSLKGIGRGLFELISRNFPGWIEERHEDQDMKCPGGG